MIDTMIFESDSDFITATRLDKYIAAKNSCWILAGLMLLKASISSLFLSSLYLLSTPQRNWYKSGKFSLAICSGIRFVTRYSVLPSSNKKWMLLKVRDSLLQEAGYVNKASSCSDIAFLNVFGTRIRNRIPLEFR